jgi:hypothetical protein
MSSARLRPSGLRLPWQALAAIAVGAYVLESALRGWDFVPDVLDLIVFGAFALILIARPLLARSLRDDDDEEHHRPE